MAPQLATHPTRFWLRWSLLGLAFLSAFSIGCSPATIAMALMPWTSNNVDPEYKLFAKDKEITLVMLVNFAQPPFDPDHVAIQSEFPNHLAQFFRKRCQENKHKIKIVAQTEVRSKQEDLQARGTYTPIEVGKHFKADYVLELNIQSCSLYEKNHYPKAYRGTAEIAIDLYKIGATDEDEFHKDMRFEFPGLRGPIDAGTMNAAAFRRLFLNKVARDVSKLFIAFPNEERNLLE